MSTRTKTGAGALVLLGWLMTAPPSSLAQGHGAAGGAAAAGPANRAPSAVVTKENGVTKIVFKDAAVITAQVQKPSVFFVIDHEQLGNYQWQSLKQNFLPKIIATVQKDPF